MACLGGVDGPVVRRLRKQPQDRRVGTRRDLGPVARGRDRRRAEVLADDRDCVVAGKRRLAGQQLVEHRAERVEVRAGVGGAAERLLGRQVGDRADEHPLDRSPRAAIGRGEAEVAEPGGSVVAEPDVGGLEVAVDDAARVRVLERPADVDRDRDRAVDLEAATVACLDHTGEVAAADVLADHDTARRSARRRRAR